MKIKPETWLILFALTFIWGSSFILMKKGLESFSPMQVGALRICFAGLVMLPVAVMNIRKVPREAIYFSILFGLLNAGIPNFLFPLSETKVDSSTAGILNGLTPIFTLLAGVSFFGVRFTGFKLLAVITGFVGAAMLVFFRDGFHTSGQAQSGQLGYASLIVVATCMYGLAANVMKRYLDNVSGPVIAAIAYGSFAIPSAIYLATSDFTERMGSHEGSLYSLGYVAILGIFGSAIAIILASQLTKQSTALFGSFVTYLIPFVAILWGVLDGEPVGMITFISLGVIFGSIYISGLKGKRI